MKLKVKNLGPIEEVTIDLTKNLTVFCGPNNTGKTYAAYMIYGFLKEIKSRLSSLLKRPRYNSKSVDRPLTFEMLSEVFRLRTENRIYPHSQISDIYGLSQSEIRRLMSNLELEIKGLENSYQRFLDCPLAIEVRGMDRQLYSFKKQKGSEIITLKSEVSFTYNGFRAFESALNLNICKLLGLASDFYFFPVERNSFYTFSKELSLRRNRLVDELQNINHRKIDRKRRIDPFEWIDRRTTRYPLAIRDGLEIAEDMLNIQKQESSFKELAHEIETQILEGQLTVGKYGEALFVPHKAKANPLPIHLSSSLAKTFTSLIFYLKHLAQPNDLIIIDEPELNLHPDNQLKIVRILAKLVNRGFKIVMSTHSDYIIRELNNLIMVNTIKDDQAKVKALGYGTEEYLKPAEVGAYLFRTPDSENGKVKVQNLDLNEDGFEVETIDATIDKLNYLSMKLYSHIQDRKNDAQ